eukprot:scaffold130979_cov28-Tisochrysis_lutea.AAC.1
MARAQELSKMKHLLVRPLAACFVSVHLVLANCYDLLSCVLGVGGSELRSVPHLLVRPLAACFVSVYLVLAHCSDPMHVCAGLEVVSLAGCNITGEDWVPPATLARLVPHEEGGGQFHAHVSSIIPPCSGIRGVRTHVRLDLHLGGPA